MGIHFREYTGGLLTNPLVTVTLQQGSDGYTGSEDTYIYQNAPDDNYCLQDVLNVGREQQYAALVRFDLSSIPSDARVVESTLQLYASGWDGSDMTIDAYRIRRDVSICQATWNQAGDANPWDLPGCNDTDTDRGATPESSLTTSGISKWYSFNLTIAVQDWVNGRLANNGVLLRGAESGSTSLFRFASAEVGTSSLRPKLVITYRGASGSEEADTGEVGPPVPEVPGWTAKPTFGRESSEPSRTLGRTHTVRFRSAGGAAADLRGPVPGTEFPLFDLTCALCQDRGSDSTTLQDNRTCPRAKTAVIGGGTMGTSCGRWP
jgi:hypothetical protein